MKSGVLKCGVLVLPCHTQNLTRCYGVKYHIPQNNNTENFKGTFLTQNLSAIQILPNLSSPFQKKVIGIIRKFYRREK